jgi:hypothetical protein
MVGGLDGTDLRTGRVLALHARPWQKPHGYVRELSHFFFFYGPVVGLGRRKVFVGRAVVDNIVNAVGPKDGHDEPASHEVVEVIGAG